MYRSSDFQTQSLILGVALIICWIIIIPWKFFVMYSSLSLVTSKALKKPFIDVWFKGFILRKPIETLEHV
ncbi:hypothetical protein CEH05_20610 (plasmid) [Halobacillus halophilus]|nr:hypothetical protein CEH05_20610 [Halobacillus halophilus]